MKAIRVISKHLSVQELRLLKKMQPAAEHVTEIIDNDAIVFCGGKIVAVYKKVDFNTDEARRACLQMKFTSQVRSSGISSLTVNINASPRRPNLDNKCWISRLRRSSVLTHQIFEQTARELSKYYRSYFKKRFVNQVKTTFSGVKKVDKAYRIRGTPFTGGVVNKNSALPYHFDLANTDDGISCMLILKWGVAGGELILPQLDIGFACQDNYVLLFDGKSYLHGVTPIIKSAIGTGYRYTIVNYNNSGMDLCLPPFEEEVHYQQHLEKQSDIKRKKIKNNEK
ncbi:hypothetical protein J3L18_23695 [Mucilaginibacter gossypii]|uniref:hypothetical protein n=1 Tax=Mucilaginibacter gossypii TaxID=551996 RepID=UPI000DCC4174|nr:MULTISPECIES: hypothetical protein [Mucilaginibacter]QTE36109.1 hypothetical protein J3L18_23695 [Mucilaginibacter gossypii]RAV59977.1 hypothetical protein DIU36_03115 [Mucilaginibacter rubeus]